MKTLKILTATLISLTILIWSGSVSADIIMTPSDDDFYDEHEDECETESYRKYTVMTDCDIMASPVSSSVIRTAWEGQIIGINTFYTDENGMRWGYDYDDIRNNIIGEFRQCGWVKMENLQVIYDSISFVEEHEEEFAEYAGELDKLPSEGNICLWEYPGSQELAAAVPPEELLLPDARYVYTDISGNKWVYIDQRNSGWIYAPDPCADLRSGAAVTAEAAARVAYVEAVPERSMADDFLLPVILAVFAAAVSGALLCISKKRSRPVPMENAPGNDTVS